MEAIENLFYGLQVAITPGNLLAAFIGVALGTLIGVLPGLGPLAGAALVLPFTYSLDPAAAIIMIAGIYYGGVAGGSITSALLKLPGETSSVVQTLDGYQRATTLGRPGPTLFLQAISGTVATVLSLVLVVFFSPLIADFGLNFGPAEFFAVMTCGLIVLSRVSGGTFLENMFPLLLGVLAGTVGQEAVSSASRFTFGQVSLTAGLEMGALAIGLFGIAEMYRLATRSDKPLRPKSVRIRDMAPSREEWRRSWAPWGRGTVVGFIFGLLPGPSAALSSFASYRLESKVSKYRHQFGKGAVEGISGPEAAASAAATAGMVPVLSLGLPFSATLAFILSALMVHGIQPGPLLATQHPDVFWGVIASMFVGNLMLLVLNIPMIGIWVKMLRIPMYMLMPIIVLIAAVGAYAGRHYMIDVYTLAIASVIGYVLVRVGFSLVPMVLGFVLGPLIETHLRQGLYLSRGDLSFFFTSPITVTLYTAAILVFLGAFVMQQVKKRNEKRNERSLVTTS
jgi:putative tricarboxylic transport membrane protein